MKYYAMLDERVCGPFEPETLTGLPGCSRRTLVQPQERLNSGHPRWSEAGDVPLLAVLMDMRDRGGAPARFSIPRDDFRTPRRGHERGLTGATVEEAPARPAAPDDGRSEFGRLAGRLEALERAVRGVRTAVYCGTAVVGLVGMLAALSLKDVRRGPALAAQAAVQREPAPSPAPPPAPPVPAAPAPSRPAAAAKAPAAPAPSRRPPPAAVDEEAEAALELVEGHRLPASGAARCPRSVMEARTKLGAPARTPREASSCAAMEAVLTLYDTLVAEHRWPEDKAARLLDRVVRERGGLDAAFPPESRARRLAGRTYAVELRRRDTLSAALAVLLDSDIPPAAPAVLRYEADLASGEVRPLSSGFK